jgi:sugar phosphate permease
VTGAGDRYRWVVLAVGAFGAAAFSAFRMGLPSLGPEMRDVYALSLGQVGLALASLSVGVMVTTVAWGVLTDRIGERPVLAGGLLATAAALALLALSSSFAGLLAGLFAAGAFGGSSTGASGRAIMGWFGRRERGFALGIRQMALPAGGAIGAIALPALAGAGGLRAAFLSFAGLSVVAAGVTAALMRDPPPAATPAPTVERPAALQDPRIWRLGTGSGLLVIAQAAMLGFLVLFLHDERGVPAGLAAGVLALVQVLGAFGRIAAGRSSDRGERRIAPMRRQGLVSAVILLVLAATTWTPSALLIPIVVAGGVATMVWNGLAFTAAAEISGHAQAATAMSVQNTFTAVGTVVAPIAFGVIVELTSWPVAFGVLAVFPLAAWVVLAPLVGEEDGRAAARTARTRAQEQGQAAEAVAPV